MKLQKPLVILAALALAGTLIGLTATNLSQSLIIGTQSGVIHSLSSNSDALREQVKGTGETPIAPSAKTVVREAGEAGKRGEAGAAGVQGPRGFTGDQGVRGDVGLTGVTGLLGAVGAVGSDGLPGATGADGADGSNGATGADGATGATGPDGDTGRGITSVACQDDTDWLFTMTDDSTITVPGPCRVGPAVPKP